MNSLFIAGVNHKIYDVLLSMQEEVSPHNIVSVRLVHLNSVLYTQVLSNRQEVTDSIDRILFILVRSASCGCRQIVL